MYVSCNFMEMFQISELEDDNPEFGQVASGLSESLAAAGYTHRLSSANKADAVLKVLLHEVILSRKAELDQLALGLGPLLDVARQHPEFTSSLLTYTATESLTAQGFLDLCTFESTVPAHLHNYFVQYVRNAGLSAFCMCVHVCASSVP